MAEISIIVAVAKDNAIGKNNNLLWNLPNDLKYFKSKTFGKPIIMGKNTFLSLPNGALPNRKNIVISHSDVTFPNTITYNSIEEAIESLKDEDEIFIIGGAQIYEQTLKYATKLYITEVDELFPDADAYFPEIDKTIWKEVYREENKPDENHKYGYNYTTFLKKNKI